MRATNPLLYTLFFLYIFLGACSQQTNKTTKEIIEVTKKPFTHQLFFSTTLAPARIVNLSTPVAGTIKTLNFSYGDILKKNQLLLTLDSKELKEKYQEALTGFIEKQEAWRMSELKFSGTARLNKVGLITANDYRSEKNAHNDAYIAFVQAKSKLQEITALFDNHSDLEKFIFEQASASRDNIDKALSAQTGDYKLYAPDEGIALLPINTHSDASEAPLRTLSLGDNIKADDTVVSLGKLEQLRLDFSVNETDLSKLALDQAVTVSSISFDTPLSGKITKISKQAVQSTGQSLPAFPVEVLIPAVPDALKSQIHIGMTAKITLTLHFPSCIQIPLDAIIEKNNKTYVSVSSGQTETLREITPGQTTQTDVVVLSGLSAGEKIVVSH